MSRAIIIECPLVCPFRIYVFGAREAPQYQCSRAAQKQSLMKYRFCNDPRRFPRWCPLIRIPKSAKEVT
jgi:hypothetical protein